MDRIAAELSRVAPTNLSVMLLGESGTGKEVAARELHRASGRKGAFHAVNCAAIPATLLESELFGYKRGCIFRCRSRQAWSDSFGGPRDLVARRNR